METFSRALMDPALLSAFRYDEPREPMRRAARLALRTRARALAFAPSRRKPALVIDSPRIRSYPNGYDVRELGTFPAAAPSAAGCPVPVRSA